MRALLVLLCASASLRAAPPVIVYRPVPAATVVSPLTTPASQSSQGLLNQINATLTQRRFEHQVITANARVFATPAVRPER